MGQIFHVMIQDETLRKEWSAVRNKANLLYGRRNVIAHGTTWGNDPAGLTEIGWSWFTGKGHTMMTYKQVKEAIVSFTNYAERVTNLAIAANKHLAART